MADVFLLCSFDIVFNPPQNLTGTGPSIGSVDPVPMRGIFSSTQSFCLKVSEWFIWSATTGKGLPNAFSTSSRKKRGRQRILAHRSSEEISRNTRWSFGTGERSVRIYRQKDSWKLLHS